MTSRNLLIDAVSLPLFAASPENLSSFFGNGCLFLVGVQQVLRSKSVRLTGYGAGNLSKAYAEASKVDGGAIKPRWNKGVLRLVFVIVVVTWC